MDLDDGERYAAAALFTLALHTTQVETGVDEVGNRLGANKGAWGCPDEELFDDLICVPENEYWPGMEVPSGFWGFDCCAPQGLCRRVYQALGIVETRWPGLLKMPEVHDAACAHDAQVALVALVRRYGALLDPTVGPLIDRATAACEEVNGGGSSSSSSGGHEAEPQPQSPPQQQPGTEATGANGSEPRDDEAAAPFSSFVAAAPPPAAEKGKGAEEAVVAAVADVAASAVGQVEAEVAPGAAREVSTTGCGVGTEAGAGVSGGAVADEAPGPSAAAAGDASPPPVAGLEGPEAAAAAPGGPLDGPLAPSGDEMQGGTQEGGERQQGLDDGAAAAAAATKGGSGGGACAASAFATAATRRHDPTHIAVLALYELVGACLHAAATASDQAAEEAKRAVDAVAETDADAEATASASEALAAATAVSLESSSGSPDAKQQRDGIKAAAAASGADDKGGRGFIFFGKSFLGSRKRREEASGGEVSVASLSGQPSARVRVVRRPLVRWYDARLRVALRRFCHWLRIPAAKMHAMEQMWALQTLQLRPDGEFDFGAVGEGCRASARYSTYLKISAGALGGAALLALTGGLAAPAIAAGLGSAIMVLHGGAAAATAVTSLGATTAGTAAITSTFGVIGASHAGSKTADLYGDLKEFGFWSISAPVLLPPLPSVIDDLPDPDNDGPGADGAAAEEAAPPSAPPPRASCDVDVHVAPSTHSVSAVASARVASRRWSTLFRLRTSRSAPAQGAEAAEGPTTVAAAAGAGADGKDAAKEGGAAGAPDDVAQERQEGQEQQQLRLKGDGRSPTSQEEGGAAAELTGAAPEAEAAARPAGSGAPQAAPIHNAGSTAAVEPIGAKPSAPVHAADASANAPPAGAASSSSPGEGSPTHTQTQPLERAQVKDQAQQWSHMQSRLSQDGLFVPAQLLVDEPGGSGPGGVGDDDALTNPAVLFARAPVTPFPCPDHPSYTPPPPEKTAADAPAGCGAQAAARALVSVSEIEEMPTEGEAGCRVPAATQSGAGKASEQQPGARGSAGAATAEAPAVTTTTTTTTTAAAARGAASVIANPAATATAVAVVPTPLEKSLKSHRFDFSGEDDDDAASMFDSDPLSTERDSSTTSRALAAATGGADGAYIQALLAELDSEAADLDGGGAATRGRSNSSAGDSALLAARTAAAGQRNGPTGRSVGGAEITPRENSMWSWLRNSRFSGRMPVHSEGAAAAAGGDGGDNGGRASKASQGAMVLAGDKGQLRPLLPVPVNPRRSGDATLALTIAVNGWVKQPDDFVAPWQPLPSGGRELWALVWESDVLKSLGGALGRFIRDKAIEESSKMAVRVGVSSALVTAVMPAMAVMSAINITIGSRWRVALRRAQLAGRCLAHMLMQGAHGDRPVTLIGFSVGARLIFHCLLELSRCGARGLVESAVLLGTPVSANEARWKQARVAVSGRLVNAFSANDWVLGVIFRAHSKNAIVQCAAGLAPVAVAGVENINLSSLIGGHTQYLEKLEDVLSALNLAEH